MKLRTRLYTGFVVILLMMLALSGTMILMLGSQYRAINSVVTDHYNKVKLSYSIRFGITTIQTDVNELVDPTSRHSNAVLMQSIDAAAQTVGSTLNQLQSYTFAPRSADALAKIVNSYQDYQNAVNQVIDSVESTPSDTGQIRVERALADSVSQTLFGATDTLVQDQSRLMDDALQSARMAYQRAIEIAVAAAIVTILLAVAILLWLVRGITRRLSGIRNVMTQIAFGTGSYPRLPAEIDDEIGSLASAFNEMATALEKQEQAELEHLQLVEAQNWLQTSLSDLSAMAQGQTNAQDFGQMYLGALVTLVNAHYGVLYARSGITGETRKGNEFHLLASYALPPGALRQTVEIGEGLAGQAALDREMRLVRDVPPDYLKVESALGAALPGSLLIAPIVFEEEVLGVVEFATLGEFSDLAVRLVELVRMNLATTLNRIERHLEVQRLLHQTQSLNEELQTQSEELQVQQEELRTMNEELNAQFKSADQRAKELEHTRQALLETAERVQIETQYKSQFLANMSHELRTPLNSILILAELMERDEKKPLEEHQLEYIRTIRASGDDLLNLINDVLDLSKIEAGQLDMSPGLVNLRTVAAALERQFRPMARERELDFRVEIVNGLPEFMVTDEQRLLQVLRNLLSNALKFTLKGSVLLCMEPRDNQVVFSVTDTGIGIAPDKHQMIFEAFKQAEGDTNRRFGGTGLGLSISQQLAEKLGGFLAVHSTEGAGSTFSLILPLSFPALVTYAAAEVANRQQDDEVSDVSLPASPMMPDESFFAIRGEALETDTSAHASHNKLTGPGDFLRRYPDEAGAEAATDEAAVTGESRERYDGKTVLVVDDDLRNAFALTGVLERIGCQVKYAETGREAVEMLEQGMGIDLVLMDIMMPEMDGFEAMRHIRRLHKLSEVPIIALTAKAMKADKMKCLEAGASDYVSKPIHMEQLLTLLRIWLY